MKWLKIHPIPKEDIMKNAFKELMQKFYELWDRAINDLQCCGNCKLKHDKIECPEYDWDYTNPVHSGGYCDKYQSDQLTQNKRQEAIK